MFFSVLNICESIFTLVHLKDALTLKVRNGHGSLLGVLLAVALPSAPNVITCVVESNEPVVDPSDSDEEADQGPTLVHSDDEPMVNVGRFSSALSVAGTTMDSAQPTLSEHSLVVRNAM